MEEFFYEAILGIIEINLTGSKAKFSTRQIHLSQEV